MKLNSEAEQSLYRVLFTGAILAYLLFHKSSVPASALVFCSAYLFVGILSYVSTIYYPQPSVKRQWISLVMDLAAVSYGFVLTGELGGLFFGVYLWVIVGYGLRYGAKFLKVGVVLGLLSFISAVQLNTYWLQHPYMVYGLAIAMLLIPVHTNRLLHKLSIATEKAEAANKAKSNFISHISHEIRTPLNGIVGACSLLMTTNDKDEQKNLTKIMQNSSELLVELVNNVLDLSKIENGKMQLEHVNFDLNALIKNTVALFESSAKQKNIALVTESALSESINVRGDFLHIKQVIINLLGNAIKFTEQGSVILRVGSSVQDDQHIKLKFEIVDTGIGISEEALPEIFDSFTQANESIKYKFGGTGLGTAICKELVSLMGGNIGVESKLGSGSTFWFEVPLVQLSVEEAQEHASNVISLNAHIQRVAGEKRALRILAADDNTTNLTILTKILEKSGHKVTTAINGEVALDLLEEHEYDLMILDKNMPERDGFEVIKMHHALNVNKPKVPSIILSADSLTESYSAFELSIADAYLTKPLNTELLLDTIEKLSSHVVNLSKTAEVISYRSKEKVESKVSGLINTKILNNLALLDRNDGFMESLMNGFFADAEVSFKELKASIAKRDFLAINHIGHTLAGSARNVGAEKLGDLSYQFNEFVPYDDLETIEALLIETRATYELTKPELLRYTKRVRVPSMS